MLKQPIIWSEKLIEKFGNTLFPALAEKRRKLKKFWSISSGTGRVDVNEWLKGQLDSTMAQAVVADNGWNESKDYDYVMHQILKWVKGNIAYKTDIVVHSKSEYWQTAEETLQLCTGDCEDGAILILTLAYWSNVPMCSLELTWGRVVGGGHAYIVYTRFFDGVEVVLDWCYWYTSLIIKLRKWFGLEESYLELWGQAWVDHDV